MYFILQQILDRSVVKHFVLLIIISNELHVNACVLQNTSLMCSAMKGKFIALKNKTLVETLFVINSDMSSLSEDDFLNISSLKSLLVYNSTLSASESYKVNVILDDESQLKSSQNSTKFFKNLVHTPELKVLSLQSVNLTSLERQSFTSLKKIETIDLSHNKVSQIASRIFEDNRRLKHVDLTYNRIGENFDISYLTQESMCIFCSKNKRNVTDQKSGRCPLNFAVDELWRISKTGVDVRLQGNPICGKVGGTQGDAVQKCSTFVNAECPKHHDRCQFLLRACWRDLPQRRKRSVNAEMKIAQDGSKHGPHGEHGPPPGYPPGWGTPPWGGQNWMPPSGANYSWSQPMYPTGWGGSKWGPPGWGPPRWSQGGPWGAPNWWGSNTSWQPGQPPWQQAGPQAPPDTGREELDMEGAKGVPGGSAVAAGGGAVDETGEEVEAEKIDPVQKPPPLPPSVPTPPLRSPSPPALSPPGARVTEEALGTEIVAAGKGGSASHRPSSANAFIYPLLLAAGTLVIVLTVVASIWIFVRRRGFQRISQNEMERQEPEGGMGEDEFEEIKLWGVHEEKTYFKKSPKEV